MSVTALVDRAGRQWQADLVDPADSMIVVGYAKVPATSASRSTHEYLSITLRIERDTGTVTEVDSTAVTALVRAWVAELLLGVDFGQDISAVTARIDSDYLGHGAGAIKQAVIDAWRRYAAYRAHHGLED
ncbi:DUF3870 domain-containing protein [Streptomyces bathyalis]|uniref:DUF3870 domain-containing protein n=1 Tax=Streptomyces bathyalis TaxID=2710756 RepID=A0A7T1TC83_9ACTN|nr:DUF3870 domain-containing protein [Streptomyces bathyalis]QPP10249.1 DUF3870 domain-containing protein [Streptomyces bathyalis]